MGRVYGQGANSAHFPHPLKEEKQGTGPPFPSYSSFLAFLSFRGEQEKRREREKGRVGIKRIAFLMGRAKKRTEKRDEWRRGRDKPRRRENGTLLYLSCLPCLSIPSFSKRKNKKEEL